MFNTLESFSSVLLVQYDRWVELAFELFFTIRRSLSIKIHTRRTLRYVVRVGPIDRSKAELIIRCCCRLRFNDEDNFVENRQSVATSSVHRKICW